jgi:KUP system potassium uptake protein
MQGTQQRQAMSALTLAALGIVFGDIGTSPIYALKECFHVVHGIPLTHNNVLGVLSLIFWSLMMVVSIKYVAIIMHANNNGEGGIMALLALSLRNRRLGTKTRSALIAIGLFGAALFFGDGIITPAVSVLSAVEGLEIATPVFKPFVIPITIAILIGLFLIQRKGTGSVGRFFGPITLLWFVSLGILGVMSIAQNPVILNMVNPYWAGVFIAEYPIGSFITMSAIVLTITGGEALYADMGHFGRKPIQLAWFFVVLPSLMLNYAGQGALLLRDPSTVKNPFYNLVPELALYPMIILATMAAVIASQALISGVFSVARQAMQLGYLPRFTVQHTSESEIGQIYIPFLNWLLLGCIVTLVILFKSSSNLASAYGLAVTMTMMCDTLLVGFVMYNLWRWKTAKVVLVVLPFFILDLVFLGSSSLKIIAGGWFPLLVGGTAFTIMMTWKRGRELLFSKLQKDTLPLQLFINSVTDSAHTVKGTAVFLTASQNVVPHALLHNLKHNKILHETNILMTVITEDIPYVDEKSRVAVERINDRFYRLVARYGFKEQPNVPVALEQGLKLLEMPFDMMMISFFVSRERILHSVGDGMMPWREKLFISMSRNTSAVSDFFQIPTNRVVEMGSQIEI